jgi:hypothetical protein
MVTKSALMSERATIPALQNSLRAIIVENLGKVRNFDPFKHFEGVQTKEDFARMLESDPAFAPFFLSTPKYIAARIGGNLITSLHRKLGDLYQALFLRLLEEQLQLPRSSLALTLEIEINGRKRRRSTDGMIPHAALQPADRERLIALLDLTKVGTAFEVRSCYQIGDSKRIQADYDMALALKAREIEPVMLIFCTTSLKSPVLRLGESWQLHEGHAAFEFVKKLTDFDLGAFLQQEQALIRPIMQSIFDLM